jgi:DNA uptake protein ComE-like DNA-binding protein
VLGISFGLVSVCLYCAHSMTLELRASDNRVAGTASAQAIEGAVRYLNNLLAYQCSYGSNGVVPDPTTYACEAVAVGAARFWVIGRDTNATTTGITGFNFVSFGLIDEGSKLNLNTASSNTLAWLVQTLPNASQELPGAILDWRSTNSSGTYQSYYSTQPQPYQGKSSPFETVDELRLVCGANLITLLGDDLNRNGVLDPNETDQNHNGTLDPGILEYVTVYSKEPNTRTNGEAKVNIRTVSGSTGPLPDLLTTALGSTRANQILVNLGMLNAGPTGGGQGGPNQQGGRGGPTRSFTSPLQFFRDSRMSSDEFARIANDITVANGQFIEGRVNVNTASAEVLATLPGLSSDPNLAQTLITYRQSNPDKLGSIAWVVEALGQNNSTTLNALQASDSITAQSYQFTADIAAIGPNGRGYRRTRFVFDTSTGTPKVIYRQDLTGLGWALGKEARETWRVAQVKR